MNTEGQGPQPSLSKAALLQRFIGNALDHDTEDILFWRNASEAFRGETLYRLRARGKATSASVSHMIEQQEDARRLVLTPKHASIITINE
jgi:hypothetical protein